MPKTHADGRVSNEDARPVGVVVSRETSVPAVLEGLIRGPEVPADYADWNYSDLLNELKARDLPRGGKTEDLVKRLREDDVK